MTRLLFRSALRAQFEASARAAFPRECCGLMEGSRRDDIIEVSALHTTRNVATEVDRFEMDPAEHIRLLREARAAGRELVGCYHSHPNGLPDPSARDLERADDEGFVWLIASLLEQGTQVRVGAFIVANGKFEPLTIVAMPATESGAGRDASR